MALRGMVLIAGLLVPSLAQAELQFCNETETRRTVGVAYAKAGQWISEGWWRIEPGACKTTLKGDLAQRHYYYTLSGQADFKGEGYSFCVKPEAFTLEGADGDCAALGGEEMQFAHIDTGETAKSHTQTLRGGSKGADQKAPDAPPPPPPPPPAAEAPPPAPPAIPPEAMVDSFVRGQQGEPFTVQAVMQRCSGPEADNGCVFYAEGTRWFALLGAGHNPAAMEALARMPVNTPVFVVGDLLSYGDITAEALISRIEPDAPDPYADLRAAMQGEWVSQDDPQSRLSITGSEEEDRYGAEVLRTSVLTLADTCPDGAEGGPMIVKQMMGGDPGDVQCYAVVSLTADLMELSYVGRGNTLVYARP